MFYLRSDGNLIDPQDHRSWMGDDYKVINDGAICYAHDTYVEQDKVCDICAMQTKDRNNLLVIKYKPEIGDALNVQNQLVLSEDGKRKRYFLVIDYKVVQEVSQIN